ncbi:MAG: hypothetical protein HRS57_00270 [Mycoplasmataceae bacterium]|nr:hypothetical protein [Mycoplasmataceae bacterium]
MGDIVLKVYFILSISLGVITAMVIIFQAGRIVMTNLSSGEAIRHNVLSKGLYLVLDILILIILPTAIDTGVSDIGFLGGDLSDFIFKLYEILSWITAIASVGLIAFKMAMVFMSSELSDNEKNKLIIRYVSYGALAIIIFIGAPLLIDGLVQNVGII